MNKVFISFKNSDRGQQTEDARIAHSLCLALRKKHLTVFFSNTSLREVGTDRYMDKIEEEISSADAMVVVGTRSEYVSRGWVRQEWMTFLNLSLSSTEKSLYTFVPEPADVQTFPAFLRPYQSFKTEADAVTFISNRFLLQDALSDERASPNLFWDRFYGIFCVRDREGACKLLPLLSLPDGIAEALEGATLLSKRQPERGMALLQASIRKGSAAGYYLAAHAMITGQSGEKSLKTAKRLLQEGRAAFRERQTDGAEVLFLVWTSLPRLSRALYCAEIFRCIMDAYGIPADVRIHDAQKPADLTPYRDVVFLLGEDSFITDAPFLQQVLNYNGSPYFLLNGFTIDAVPRAIRRFPTASCEDADIGSIGRYLITKYAKDHERNLS